MHRERPSCRVCHQYFGVSTPAYLTTLNDQLLVVVFTPSLATIFTVCPPKESRPLV